MGEGEGRLMATVYVIEPGATGGVGAMGAEIVTAVLQRAGHDARRIRVDEHRGQLDLFARQLRRPDAFFVSLLYPRQFVELRGMFERIGLDPYRDRRGPEDPLVAFGGQFAIAPEPIAEFADVIALGDGEVTAVQIGEQLDAGMRRFDIERWAAETPGLYAPRYQAPPDPFVRVEAPFHPITVAPGGDRAVPTVEAARGCASKCAFCTIGWAGGTYREAPRSDLIGEIARHAGHRLNVFAPDLSSVSYATDIEAAVEQHGCRNMGRDARMDRTLRLLDGGSAGKAYSFGVEGSPSACAH